MNHSIDLWDYGDKWLIAAVLNDENHEKEAKNSAAEVTSQNQLIGNHNSLPPSLEHHHAMDSSLPATSSHSHGAIATDTGVRDSSLGDWVCDADSEQATERNEIADFEDDITQESPASTYLRGSANEVNKYGGFNEVESQSTISEDGNSTDSGAPLTIGPENDQFPDSPMNQSTTMDEDLTTEPDDTDSEPSRVETCPMDDDNETKEDFKQRLIYWIAQMMFVSGETAEPSPETTWMIEEIVREQVLEMVCLYSLFSGNGIRKEDDHSMLTVETSAPTSYHLSQSPWFQIHLHCRLDFPNSP